MSSSIRQSQLEAYGITFSQRVCQDVFEKKKYLVGRDLLTLTPIQQVNYFVLRVLYRAWQQEMLHMKSPCFDYQEKTVREGLHTFMNILSQHIRVGQQALEPLLAKACQDTLQLILMPKAFFQHELVDGVSVLSATYLRNTQKYLRINLHVLEAFIQQFEAEKQQEISAQQASVLFSRCAEALTQCEEVGSYLKQFAALTPLPVAFDTAKVNPLQPPEIDASMLRAAETLSRENPVAPKKTTAPPSMFASPQEEPEPVEPPQTTPLGREDEREGNGMFDMREIDKPAAEAPTADEVYVDAKPEVATTTPQKETEPVEDTPTEGRKRSFSHIPRSQAEDFIRSLFNNKQHIFMQALQDVARCDSFDDAVDLLLRSYGKPQGWNLENTDVKELFKQVFFYFREA